MRPNRTISTDRARGVGRRRPIRRGRRLDARPARSEAQEPDALDAFAESSSEDSLQEDEEDEPAVRSKHSRPPAPAFLLGAEEPSPEDDEAPPEDHEALPEDEAVGTELALDEEAPSSGVLSAGDRVSSDLPLAERQTIQAELEPETPRDGGWLGSAPVSSDGLTDAERAEQESFPPVVEELEEEGEEPALSEEQLRRRGRLRRFVAAAVVAACAVTAGLVAMATLSPELGYAQRQGTASAARLVQQVALAHRAKSAHTQEAPAAAQPAAEEPETALANDADYEEVSKETLRLLNAREFESALKVARRLVDMRPTSAFGYRCLGSALQDLNRMKEAREVYSECVTNATKGEVFECSALGGTSHKLPQAKP